MCPVDSKVWTAMETFMFPQHKWQEAVTEVEGVIRMAQLQKGDRIVDIPCGIGRHALQLARRDFQVTGIDITSEFLQQARRRAGNIGLNVEWLRADMREFCRPNAFDAAINLYTSFGYFEDPADDLRVLENIFCSLKSGGRLLMDLMSRDIFIRTMPMQTCTEQSDGSQILSEHSFTKNGKWLENKWMHIDGENQSQAQVGLRLYLKEELEDLVHKAGFVSVQAFGDFDGSQYDETARHLLLLCQKP